MSSRFTLRLSLLVFIFILFGLLVGCGTTSSKSPNPPLPPGSPAPPPGSPPPSPPPPGSPPPSSGGTYIYARISDSQVAGFRLNSDGSLTALGGSPFPVMGMPIAASGSHFFSAEPGQLLVYSIDPATGALAPQSQASADMATVYSVAAQGGFVYVVAKNSANNFVIDGFAVAQNGTLTAVPGSPLTFDTACDLCASPEIDSVSIDARYLAVGTGGSQGGGGALNLFTRQSSGAVQPASRLGSDSVISVSLHPSDQFLYEVQGGEASILVVGIDANGGTRIVQDYNKATFEATAADPSGKFVVASGGATGLDSLAVQSDGTVIQTAQASTASQPFDVVFDPSGHFAVVRESGGLAVYGFNSATGALNNTANSATVAIRKPTVVSF